MAEALVEVDGVVGVVLGGSRARGTHRPDSDYDLGVYYRGDLDVDRLGELARRFGGPATTITEPGAWGPWVDGGGWLTVDGVAIDWLYRDADRVQASWRAAQRGEYSFHQQAGHPLGVPDFAYAGEIALAVVLADPSGELAAVRTQAQRYPEPLRAALRIGLWEATFSVEIAAKAAGRGDAAYVAGCLFRAVGICAHALHGHEGRWLINEKGAVAAAGALPSAPADFAARADRLLGAAGTTAAELSATVADARALVAEVGMVVGGPGWSRDG
ncbi:nucleotidyltransferase domain-containing protein [Jiangella rhizosphaerae]|uniref:Nucleotidyltransferase domain-containing protein n=1 Tax=Jiangella rhizosphaerae TaxID=2293569 RepID=A0A418KLV1_9ACTN|nr:nucleotidyltransferase domain-containing protein [Jiangella rhizosphaerae]